MSQHPPILIVNENDKPVGEASMEEIHKNGLLHRSAAVIVKDSHGNILLQRRSPGMSTYPNTWDASAAGHVDTGEDYITSAKRELFEEIGIKDVDLKEVAYYQTNITYEWRKINAFKKVYVAIVPPDTRFVVNSEEITELKWFTQAELESLIADNTDEIVPDFANLIQKLNL